MGGEKIGRKTVVSIIILIILLSSACVYIIHDTENCDTVNDNSIPIVSVISVRNISAKTAFPFAEKVALEWYEDALLNKCKAPYKSEKGNSSVWQFEFYSPSTLEHFNYSIGMHWGPNRIIHHVKCEYIIVTVNINGTIESELSCKTRMANHPKPYNNWNIDSDQAYQIASTNKTIITQMYNKDFKNTNHISFGTVFNVTSIRVSFSETEIHNTEGNPHMWYSELITCYISPDTGEIIDIDIYA